MLEPVIYFNNCSVCSKASINSTAIPSLYLDLEPLPKSGQAAKVSPPKAANTANIANTANNSAFIAPKNPAQNYVCSVLNCKVYREAQRWPEPLSFYDFPPDPERKKYWLQVKMEL